MESDTWRVRHGQTHGERYMESETWGERERHGQIHMERDMERERHGERKRDIGRERHRERDTHGERQRRPFDRSNFFAKTEARLKRILSIVFGMTFVYGSGMCVKTWLINLRHFNSS